MAQITALISGPNKTFDYQVTALARSILNQGVLSSTDLLVSTNSVAAGEAFILCTRTNGQKIMVHFQNTAAVTISTSGTTKVWVGISQGVIDDGSTNAIDGTGIATIQTGASYPSTNYIPLASITGGVITDARSFITAKALLGMGYAINKMKEIDPTTGNEVLRDLSSGSPISLTSLFQIIDPTTRARNEVQYSALKADMSPSSLIYDIGLANGEALLSSDQLALYTFPTTSSQYVNVGDIAGNEILTFYGYSSGVSGNAITLVTDRVSGTNNMQVRVVTTDGSGVATTTQVDPNAIQTIVPANVTSGGNTVITFPGNFSCGVKGTKVGIQVCQGTFASPLTNGSNYYKIGHGDGNKQIRPTITNSASYGGLATTDTTAIINLSCTANKRLLITDVFGGASIPSGSTITISSGGYTYSWTVVTSGATQAVPMRIEIPSGQAFSVVSSATSFNSQYYQSAASTTDLSNIIGNSSFTLNGMGVKTKGLGEMIKTSNLFEASVIMKAVANDSFLRTVIGTSPSSQSIATYPAKIGQGFFPSSGLTQVDYYLATTPGLITSSPDSKYPSIKVGRGVSSNIFRTLALY